MAKAWQGDFKIERKGEQPCLVRSNDFSRCFHKTTTKVVTKNYRMYIYGLLVIDSACIHSLNCFTVVKTINAAPGL